MTRLRYHYEAGQLSDNLSSDGVSLHDPDVDYASEFYHRVGQRFPVVWESKSRAEPVIETNDLPDTVSESDVENALTAMKNDGIL